MARSDREAAILDSSGVKDLWHGTIALFGFALIVGGGLVFDFGLDDILEGAAVVALVFGGVLVVAPGRVVHRSPMSKLEVI